MDGQDYPVSVLHQNQIQNVTTQPVYVAVFPVTPIFRVSPE